MTHAAHPVGYLEEFGISEDALQARGLNAFAEAGLLEIAEVGEDGREHRLTPQAASAWRELKAEAGRDGEVIFIVSAFRSVGRQAAIVRAKLASGQSIKDILTVSAFPGYSEHHTGRAADLSAPGLRLLEADFEQSSAYRWLIENAGHFGFHLSYPKDNALGYQFEPWHWCYRDKT